MIACGEVECYQICLSYGFFASCLWTRFSGRLELRSLTSQKGSNSRVQGRGAAGRPREMIIAWGVSTLFWAVCRGHKPEGIEEGRTQCCQSAVSEQCLRNPNLVFGCQVYALSQSFAVRKHERPGATLRT